MVLKKRMPEAELGGQRFRTQEACERKVEKAGLDGEPPDGDVNLTMPHQQKQEL